MKQFLIILLLLPLSTRAQNFNCFSILVGNQATTNGSVMLAHNEDDHGERLVNFYKLPAQWHQPTDSFSLTKGASMAHAPKTAACLWLNMPDMHFSDSYLNEHGVAITSNSCPSREDKPQLTHGGIGYQLRRLMALRATSAREAVKIGGALIERYGYYASGRSYSIADAHEAWLLSVVNGKHWVAQRVPDHQVMILPNYYTIDAVNLADTLNFMGSPDLISYAQERGWYKPKRDGAFSFRKAYGAKHSLKHPDNISRKWMALELITGKSFDRKADFPFAVTPKSKLSRQDVMALLRSHYEDTAIDQSESYQKQSPHATKLMAICSNTNQYGFIAELRPNMPAPVGSVLWLAMRRPCTQPFVPWYAGLSYVPDNLAAYPVNQALTEHFAGHEHIHQVYPRHGFLPYSQFAEATDNDYGEKIAAIAIDRQQAQQAILDNFTSFDSSIQEKWEQNPRKAREKMNAFLIDNLHIASAYTK